MTVLAIASYIALNKATFVHKFISIFCSQKLWVNSVQQPSFLNIIRILFIRSFCGSTFLTVLLFVISNFKIPAMQVWRSKHYHEVWISCSLWENFGLIWQQDNSSQKYIVWKYTTKVVVEKNVSAIRSWKHDTQVRSSHRHQTGWTLGVLIIQNSITMDNM